MPIFRNMKFRLRETLFCLSWITCMRIIMRALDVHWSVKKPSFKIYFSNSLIIHKEKTKEITTVKEVWICGPNYHKIRRSFALIFSKNYQCFEKFEKAAPRFFNQLLSVWISDETLYLVFDILHEPLLRRTAIAHTNSLNLIHVVSYFLWASTQGNKESGKITRTVLNKDFSLNLHV